MAVGMRPTQYSEALVKITKNTFEHELRHRIQPTHPYVCKMSCAQNTKMSCAQNTLYICTKIFIFKKIQVF
jgi:hypothetical protein